MDLVIISLFSTVLVYSAILDSVGIWLIYSFLQTSNKFGNDVQLKINPFDPDAVGGLSPLSELSTLLIFDIGFLSILIIPIWQIFLPQASYVMIFVTSVLMPAYFFLSMRGIYDRLKEEKEKTLLKLNEEIQSLSRRIQRFLDIDHSVEEMDDKEILVISNGLNALELIYKRIKSMHTFPVNAEIMAKIFLSAILPVIALLIDVVQAQIL